MDLGHRTAQVILLAIHFEEDKITDNEFVDALIKHFRDAENGMLDRCIKLLKGMNTNAGDDYANCLESLRRE